MDKELVKIYNNISIEKTEKNSYRKKIRSYVNDYSQVVYYSSEEEYLEDCSSLFNKVITKKEKLKGRKIPEKLLKAELENYLFLKLLIEKRITVQNFDINNERKNTVKEIKKYENSFKNYIETEYPLKEFKVYNVVYNIKISEKKEEFGIYTLYKTSENEEYLKEYLRFLTENSQHIGEIILETKVEARDQESANEIAREKNEIFIDIVNFISPNYISVERNYFRENRYSLAISDDGSIWGNTYNESNRSLNFDKIKKFPYSSKLLSLIVERELSFMENKIKVSLRWYREFLHERNKINSFLKGMIALEGLSVTKELGDKYGFQDYLRNIIPMILEEKDNKENLSKQLKEFYTKRSEIAHGEKKSYVDDSDRESLKEILYGIFEKFLTEESYQNLTTKEKYNSFFEDYYLFKKMISNREKIKITIIKKSELCKKDRTTYYKDSSGEIFEFPLFKGSNSSRKIEKIYVLDGEFIKAISKDFTNSVSFCQDCYLKVKGKCKREYKSICRNLNINYELVDWYNILFLFEFPFYKNLVSEQFKKRFKIELENIKNGESFILEEN